MYDYNYSYGYSSTTTGNNEMTAAVILMMFLVMFLVFIVAYAVTSFFLGKIFKKAGQPAWAAWVPVYNNWKLLEMGGQHGFWAILAFVPFVNIAAIIFQYIAMYHIGLKFGKEGVFVLLAIFLPIVWIIWLAVDKTAVWQGVPTQAAAAPPKTTTQ